MHMKRRDLLESLAVAAHGGSAVLNVLGIFYNAKKGNRIDTLVHSAGLVYHVVAVVKHARAT